MHCTWDAWVGKNTAPYDCSTLRDATILCTKLSSYPISATQFPVTTPCTAFTGKYDQSFSAHPRPGCVTTGSGLFENEFLGFNIKTERNSMQVCKIIEKNRKFAGCKLRKQFYHVIVWGEGECAQLITQATGYRISRCVFSFGGSHCVVFSGKS